MKDSSRASVCMNSIHRERKARDIKCKSICRRRSCVHNFSRLPTGLVVCSREGLLLLARHSCIEGCLCVWLRRKRKWGFAQNCAGSSRLDLISCGLIVTFTDHVSQQSKQRYLWLPGDAIQRVRPFSIGHSQRDYS